MPSVHTLPDSSASPQVFAPWWRARPSGQAQPWRSAASMGLDPEPGTESLPGTERVGCARCVSGAGGVASPGTPDVVESAPVPRCSVRDHHPIPQEA